ncbi:AAA family ATPase, partial [Candidatus Poribacteria bacterium]|nr:AAA family ATPase [Candidatus Poribacteria bacterium]
MAVPITQQRNPYIVGRPITEPERFFGREDIFRFINDGLDSGIRIMLLYGQRRIGKSTVLSHIQHFVNQEDVHLVQFDLQGQAASPLPEVLYNLAEAIADSLEDEYDEAIPLPDDSTEFEEDPNYFQRRFLSAVYEIIGTKRLLLLLDEFDVLNDYKEDTAAGTFFPYLQRLLQAEKRLFIIPVVGRRLEEVPVLQSLFREALYQNISLLDSESARRLIVKPVEGTLDFDEGAIEAILNLTAGHPYFTQLMGYELFHYSRDQERAHVTAEDVHAVIDTAIERGTGGLVWFRDGLSVIGRVILSAVAEATEGILSAVAKATEGGTAVVLEGAYATQEAIEAILERHDVQLLPSELIAVLDQLVGWETLKDVDGRGYRVTIELVRRWVVKEHPLRRAKRELDEYQEMQRRVEIESYRQKAKEAFDKRRYHDAIEQWKKLLELDPDDEEAKAGANRAQNLLELREYLSGLEEVVAANKEAEAVERWEGLAPWLPAPDEIPSTYHKEIEQLRATSQKRAEQLDNAQAQIAELESDSSNLNKEIAELQSTHAERLKQTKTQVWIGLALIALLVGGNITFGILWRQEQSHVVQLRARGMLNLAQRQYDNEAYQSAIDTLDRLLAISPDNIDAIELRSNVFNKKAEALSKAREFSAQHRHSQAL